MMDPNYENPFESVIFRNSRIIYPENLNHPVEHWQNTATSEVDHRPRDSVLEAFDPLYHSSVTVDTESDDNFLDWVYFPSLGDRTDEPPTPPPIPPRNVSLKWHYYDPVSLEDSRVNSSDVYLLGDQSNSENTIEQTSTVQTSELSESKQNLSPSLKKLAFGKIFLNKVSVAKDLKGFLRDKHNSQAENVETAGVSASGVCDISPNVGSSIGYGGLLYWGSPGKKDSQPLWTELKNGVLSSYHTKNTEDFVNRISLDKVTSIGIPVSNLKAVGYSFEVVWNKEMGKTTTITTNSNTELTKWMEWILENSTCAFDSDLRQHYARAGKVYVKEGICGEWKRAWILVQIELKKLWLQYVEPDGRVGDYKIKDLRKVRSALPMKLGDEGGCSLATQPGPVIVVNWNDCTLYLQSNLKMDTDNWLQIIRTIALESGRYLCEQQLTGDDVPVIVECCVKFVETRGILSEGIYRKSGHHSRILRLLEMLKTDAWNAHISHENFSEHDVANALKKFIRTLPEPLLMNELHAKWIATLDIHDLEQRTIECQQLLWSLPHVNRQTLNRLLGHLYAVQNNCEKNLMSTKNLAAIWGPTLMTVENDDVSDDSYRKSNLDTDVVLFLIQHYPWLFDVDREKLEVNRYISELQCRLENGEIAKKSAGDIRTWITNEIAGEEVAFEIGPKFTAGNVVEKLAEQQRSLNSSAAHQNCLLMETICNGDLKRPLHLTELLLPVILKWVDWPEDLRKGNQLVFGRHHFTEDFLPLTDLNPKSMFEIHYSNPKMKCFRHCPFEFCQARLTILKDLKNHTVQGQWNIEDIVWYLGNDSRRNAPSKWCITFIEKCLPIKKNRFFGHCLSFMNERDYKCMVTSMILTQCGGGIKGFTLSN